MPPGQKYKETTPAVIRPDPVMNHHAPKVRGMMVRRLIELPVISYRQTGCPVRVGGELKDHPGYVGCSGLLLVS